MNQRPVIIVTGSGRGIGAATAKLAGERGYAVCVNYVHDRESAEGVARGDYTQEQ
jgi:NAD(P)-dependent dehydrogenase (short-subunit alcohol dehydrogenase family)